MTKTLTVGEEAPNFDLSSTEDVVLMLRDEVVRSAVLLYFFGECDDRSRQDLRLLARRVEPFRRHRVKIFGVSAVKMDLLKAVQKELELPFPLLHDDRGFARAYGAEAPEEGTSMDPTLVLVGRDQRVLWIETGLKETELALEDIASEIGDLPSPTTSYPRSVINGLVDRWVN
jgi:peroxiredoxin